ncbi:MAG: polysaccharide biosynthesis protein [Elusimicrobia bacterium]|nr:polysaccharide biosynthesis protein [Elusimicrobiota bacterium]
MRPFEGKRILVTGGTGSLGKVLVHRLLDDKLGKPKKIIIFSRDEAKQHEMRLEFKHKRIVTEEIIYHNFDELVEFRIGDVRDFHSISSALRDADIVINAAALKQVPTCEYFPYEAVKTNITGPENIIRAICEHNLSIETVVGVSTDKACKPVNVMGMSKAMQERVFIQANMRCPKTRFVCVRYGNVLASRGSVIPLFIDQIKRGRSITITDKNMTRFLINLNQAVDMIFDAICEAKRGETYIPRIHSARVIDIAHALIGKRKIKTIITGVRPGEKMHEILISEEECHRTIDRGKYYAISPILPELRYKEKFKPAFEKEYSSEDHVIDLPKLAKFLQQHHLMVEDIEDQKKELLR